MADTFANTTTGVPRCEAGPTYCRVYVWQLPIRIFHWVNAVTILVLFATGWYIANPIFSSTGEPFDNFAMAWVRQIHFIAAFVFMVAFMWRIYWFWFGNKYARSGFPYVWKKKWWQILVRQAFDYLRLNFGTGHLGHNSLAGLSYTVFAIGLGWAQMFTGFALYSQSHPGGFLDKLVGWVIPLLGGAFQTQMWHHFFAWCMIMFAIIHVYIVILDGRQYRNGLISSMIYGHKFVDVEEGGKDDF